MIKMMMVVLYFCRVRVRPTRNANERVGGVDAELMAQSSKSSSKISTFESREFRFCSVLSLVEAKAGKLSLQTANCNRLAKSLISCCKSHLIFPLRSSHLISSLI